MEAHITPKFHRCTFTQTVWKLLCDKHRYQGPTSTDNDLDVHSCLWHTGPDVCLPLKWAETWIYLSIRSTRSVHSGVVLDEGSIVRRPGLHQEGAGGRAFSSLCCMLHEFCIVYLNDRLRSWQKEVLTKGMEFMQAEEEIKSPLLMVVLTSYQDSGWLVDRHTSMNMKDLIKNMQKIYFLSVWEHYYHVKALRRTMLFTLNWINNYFYIWIIKHVFVKQSQLV